MTIACQRHSPAQPSFRRALNLCPFCRPQYPPPAYATGSAAPADDAGDEKAKYGNYAYGTPAGYGPPPGYGGYAPPAGYPQGGHFVCGF